jgi:hypothetical protein
VSLSTPEWLRCASCGYIGAPAPATVIQLKQAAAVLAQLDANTRQLGQLARKVVSAKERHSGWAISLISLMLLAGTMPTVLVLLLTVVPAVVQGRIEGNIYMLVSWGPPSLVASVALIGTVLLIKRNLRRITERSAAIAPLAMGEPCSCHICGAPLPATPSPAGVLRCTYCQADNIVSPAILSRAASRNVFDYQQSIQRMAQRNNVFPTAFALGCVALFAVTTPVACVGGCLADKRAVRAAEPPGSVRLIKAEFAQSVRVDPGRVYYVSRDSIFSAPKKAGAEPRPLARWLDLSAECPLALDDTHVYWVDRKGIPQRVSKRGGDPTPLVGSGGSADTPSYRPALAMDGTHVYWTTENHVWKVPKTGGSEQSVAAPQAKLQALAVHSQAVYFITDNRQLFAQPKAGGAPQVLASGDPVGFLSNSSLLLSDDSGVYWASGALLMKLPNGASTPQQLARAESQIQAVAMDADHVYWVTRSKTDRSGSTVAYGRLGKVRKMGGGQVTIATGAKFPCSLTVDETSLYWDEYRPGVILQLPK